MAKLCKGCMKTASELEVLEVGDIVVEEIECTNCGFKKKIELHNQCDNSAMDVFP